MCYVTVPGPAGFGAHVFIKIRVFDPCWNIIKRKMYSSLMQMLNNLAKHIKKKGLK